MGDRDGAGRDFDERKQLIVWRFARVFTPGVFAITIGYIHEECRLRTRDARTSAYVSARSSAVSAGRA